MPKKEKACKECRRLMHENECVVCRSTELTKNWKGMALIIDPDSEIAKTMDIKSPGKFAIRLR